MIRLSTILRLWSAVILIAIASTANSQTPVKTSGVTDAAPIYPLDLAVDQAGNAWVVDLNLPGVWKSESGSVTKVLEGSKRFRERMNKVRCLAFSPSGQLYVGDTATREIYRIGSDGSAEPTVGGMIGIPMDIAFSKDGTMFVADLERRVLWKVAPDQKPEIFADVNPRGVFVDSSDRIWVVSQNKKPLEQLIRLTSDGQKTVIAASDQILFPHQVVVDSSGTAWLSDGYKKAIWKIQEGMEPVVAFEGSPLVNPVGMALVDDRPVVVDPRAQAAFRLNSEGKLEEWFRIPMP